MAGEIFRLFGSVGLKTDEAEKGLDKIEGKAKTTAEKFGKMGDTFGKVGKKATSIGKNLTTKVSGPIMAIGGIAVKSAMDFESAMSEVSALSGATGSDLEKLEGIARKMGSETVFSAQESAEALQYMSLAGWETEEMVAGLEPTLKLAGAAGMELATASDIVTDTLSMYGMEAEEATKMTDMLAYAQANSNTDVEGLGEALKYAGASANAMGYDLADTAALLGTFADQGLKGSAAGTTLNAMFTDMKKNAEDGAIEIGKSSVKIVDANGKYRDMAEIMSDVEKATDSMTDAQKDQALSSIFGTQAIKGVNMVLEAGTGKLKSFEDGIRNSDGAAADMYETMNDNLKGSIEGFKSALSEVAISMGSVATPIIKKFTEWLTVGIEKFNKISPEMKKAIAIFMALAAGIGPLIWIFGALSGAISSIMGLITTLGPIFGGATAGATGLSGVLATVASAFTSVILPIGLVIGALILLYKNSETFRDGVHKIFEQVKKTFSSGMEYIKTIFQEGWKVIKAIFDVFKALFSGDFDKFWEALKKLTVIGIEALKKTFKAGLDFIKDLLKLAWEVIKTIFSTGFKAIGNLIKVHWEVIKMLFGAGLNFIKDLLKLAWEGIKIIFSTGFNAIGNLIKAGWEVIKMLFGAGRDFIINLIKAMVKAVVDWFIDMKNRLVSTVKDIWSDIVNRFKNNIADIVERVRQMPHLMADNIRKGGKALKDAFVSIWKTAVKAISNPANKIIDGANWVLEKFGASKKIAKWIPYRKGTDGHPGGHALVNDQKGSVYREAIEFPNGETVIPEGRNVLIPNMPKGTKVLPAKETKDLYRYEKGVGIWEKAKGIGSKVKEKALNVFDYLTDPNKLVGKVVEKFVSFSGMKEAPLEMAKGLVGKGKEAMVGWVKDLFTSDEAMGDYGGPIMGGIGFKGLRKTSPFGWRTHPISGTRRFHSGVDFGGGQRYGHPIHAQRGGIVNFAGRMGGYGNVVKVAQGNLEHMYAHLQKILVGVGTLISPGRLVGLMGSTGNSTGPHVHYEVRRNGRAIHPGYAKGTNNANKGWHWVGEEGPELLQFKGGEKVKSHKDSMRFANKNSKNGSGIQKVEHTGTITVRGVSNDEEFDKSVELAVKDILRRERRT